MTATCPRCLKDDRIQKVADIVSGTQAAGMASSGNIAAGVERLSRDLAALLAPPAQPKLPFDYSLLGRVIVVVVLGLLLAAGTAALLFTVNAILRGEFRTQNLRATISILTLLFVFPLVALIGYQRMSSRGRKMLASQKREWTAALDQWNRLYYCWRDNVVFDPLSGEKMPAPQLPMYWSRLLKADQQAGT